jgi:hypothetical protein
MTTEPNPRSLSLVAQTPDYVEAEAVLRQWDPEAQLVGALMHLRQSAGGRDLGVARNPVISGTNVAPRPEQTKRGRATASGQAQ